MILPVKLKLLVVIYNSHVDAQKPLWHVFFTVKFLFSWFKSYLYHINPLKSYFFHGYIPMFALNPFYNKGFSCFKGKSDIVS